MPLEPKQRAIFPLLAAVSFKLSGFIAVIIIIFLYELCCLGMDFM